MSHAFLGDAAAPKEDEDEWRHLYNVQKRTSQSTSRTRALQSTIDQSDQKKQRFYKVHQLKAKKTLCIIANRRAPPSALPRGRRNEMQKNILASFIQSFI